MCPFEIARDALLDAAVAVARLIGEDPDGAVLDAAHARFVEADKAFTALWDEVPA